MKKAIIILCALAVTVIGVMRLTPANIEMAAEQSPPAESAPICEAIPEPEETTPPTAEIAFVEPVCAEETEIVATTEPVIIEKTTQPPVATSHPSTTPPPTAPPQNISQPTEQTESGARIVDGQQQIYVPGFGWLEYNGNIAVGTVVGNDGDINKMVGSMD